MDFFLSSSIVKYEIIFLFLNLAYIIFHLFNDIISFSIRVKNILHPKKLNPEEISINPEIELNSAKDEVKTNENIVKSVIEKTEEIPEKKSIKEKKEDLSLEQKESISEFIKTIKSKMVRWEFTEAKAKIIEWLSIDKFNKDLNCFLAEIYEKDKDYKKAEFIYKDLIVLNDLDIEIYLKLWFILSVQGKYEVAYEIYKKLHSIDESNIEAIEMLANLWHHLWYFEDSKVFAKKFLKNNPRNIDILYLQALNYMNLHERLNALEMLNKVKTLEPYNVKVNELIEKVGLEIELEKNFGN